MNLLALLIAGITFFAFSPALKNQFVSWDDVRSFLTNFNYRGLSPAHLKWMFTTMYMGQYSPLAWVSSGMDYCLWHMNPMGYHLDNILIHCANAVLFFVLTLRILKLCMPRQKQNALLAASAIAALFFAIHPLRVESVAWATERRDVLGGLFFILSVLFYVQFHSREDTRSKLPWASLVSFVLAMLSKTSTLGLPAVLLCLDYYPLNRIGQAHGWFGAKTRPVWREKCLFLAVTLPVAFLAVYGQAHVNASYRLQELGLAQRAAVVSYGALFYLWKTLLPLHLSHFYELPAVVRWTMPTFAASACVVILITVILVSLARRSPGVWVVWLSYLVLFAPTSGIAQSGSQLVADRFSYFSCMGASLLLGAGLLRLYEKMNAVIVSLAAAAVLSMLGVLTYKQTAVWRTTRSLWENAVAVNPRSALAKTYLSNPLIEEGQYPEAEVTLQQSLDLDPQNADTLFMLGKLASRQKDQDKAAAYYQRSLKINPHQLDAHMNAGLIYLNRNQLPEAMEHFQLILKDDPDYAEAYVNLGIAYAMQNKLDDAIREFKRALDVDPGMVPAEVNLSRAQAMLKK